MNDKSSKREHHGREPARVLDKLKYLSQINIGKRISTTPTDSRRSNLTKHQYKNARKTLCLLTYQTQDQDPAIDRPVKDGFVERSGNRVYQPIMNLSAAKTCAQRMKLYPAHVRQVGIVPSSIRSTPSKLWSQASGSGMCQITVN